MKKSRFSEEQIIGLLREAEAGRKVADVCRKHGISEQTYQRLKQHEDENRRLKKRVADLSLDKEALQDVLSRKW